MAGEPILIVDDTPVNLKLTRILLAHEGYDVRTAGSAEEALGILPTFRPRLILADIQMPGMDGLEMTRRIKADARYRGVIVVALTALAMAGDQERAIEAGCDGYITKPIDTRTLGATVRRYLNDGRDGQEQAPTPTPTPATDPLADAGLDDLKRQFLDEALQQVPLWIEELEGQFDAEQAREVAHQWVGSGGLLGFRQVSLLAREVETILRQKPVDVGELRSTFEALLAELQDPTPVEQPEALAPEPAGGRPRAVVAGADPNLLALVKAFLESQGVDCTTAADGPAALDAIRATGPRVVVLDGLLPLMSYRDLIAGIRAEWPQTKVIVIEAEGFDASGASNGADEILVKPFDPVELVVRVKRLLE